MEDSSVLWIGEITGDGHWLGAFAEATMFFRFNEYPTKGIADNSTGFNIDYWMVSFEFHEQWGSMSHFYLDVDAKFKVAQPCQPDLSINSGNMAISMSYGFRTLKLDSSVVYNCR